MNSSEPGQPNDDEHCCDTKLNFSAAKLDVYRHERLAYTEPPRRCPRPLPIFARASAATRAMCAWLLSLF
jgi:hypothetical protein